VATMACKELVEQITGYIEGTMDPADRERLESHLERCPSCVSFVDQMRRTLRVVVATGVEQIEPERKEELLDVFREWKASGGEGEEA